MCSVETKTPSTLNLEGVEDTLSIWQTRHPRGVFEQLRHSFGQLYGSLTVRVSSCTSASYQVPGQTAFIMTGRPNASPTYKRQHHMPVSWPCQAMPGSFRTACSALQEAAACLGILNNYHAHVFCTIVDPSLLLAVMHARDDPSSLKALAAPLLTATQKAWQQRGDLWVSRVFQHDATAPTVLACYRLMSQLGVAIYKCLQMADRKHVETPSRRTPGQKAAAAAAAAALAAPATAAAGTANPPAPPALPTPEDLQIRRFILANLTKETLSGRDPGTVQRAGATAAGGVQQCEPGWERVLPHAEPGHAAEQGLLQTSSALGVSQAGEHEGRSSAMDTSSGAGDTSATASGQVVFQNWEFLPGQTLAPCVSAARFRNAVVAVKYIHLKEVPEQESLAWNEVIFGTISARLFLECCASVVAAS